MAQDPYSACACGSGKKFKWCCQPIHAEIDRAFEQSSDGQQEAALRTMELVVREHAGNPEAWGRQAQLLANTGKIDEAEQALQKAFDLNPNYAFGLLLRGTFRQQEGELLGALLLFRKAAEVYAPEAREPLAYVHQLIGDTELHLNRPVAAKAALRRAMDLDPANAELRQGFDALFGIEAKLPAAAKRDYQLRTSSITATDANDTLAEAATGRFSDVLRAFQQWTEQRPEDAAGWFNRGLVHAWLGDNPAAVQALARSVELEPDEGKAAEAWTLVEVLRCGQGMEADADYVEHRALFQIRDPNALFGLLQTLEQSGRLLGLRSDPERGILSAIVLEEMPSLVLSGASAPPAKLAAYLLITGNILQLWHPNADSVGRVVAETRQRLGGAISEGKHATGPVTFGDVVAESLLFPTGTATELEAELKIKEHAQRYFEETWTQRPLKALNGLTPLDAVNRPILRKKLLGIVQFLQDCSVETTTRVYDFDRLREKLGLNVASTPAVTATVPDMAPASADDLAALDPAAMTEPALAQAYRSALQFDARDLATRFARTLVERSVNPGAPDRYSFFAHLIGEAQAARDFDTALAYVDQGEKSDCEGNEGRRRNDFELRRGQLLAKRGDAGPARDLYQRLLERMPGDLKVAGSGAEAMLSLKQGQHARSFAEQGLAQARAQNNRDSEAYFLELMEAAKKLGA